MLNNQGRDTQPHCARRAKNAKPSPATARSISKRRWFSTSATSKRPASTSTSRTTSHRGSARSKRAEPLQLAGLSEPETVRHYVRLSRKNYSIDAGIFPLGSCTMKHNPRLNEKLARLPGFGNIHPLQPQSTVQGALALMEELSHWLLELTGMKAVALSPKAGAHGEMCGMMAIKAAIAATRRGQHAQCRAGARQRAWHESRHRRADRLQGARGAGGRGWHGASRTP